MQKNRRVEFKISEGKNVEIEYEDNFHEVVQEALSGKEFHRLHFQMFREIERLLELGAIPKDLSIGLVDFYGLKNGREIFLCWKAGEPCVEHWHEVDSGFKDRRPMSELFGSESDDGC